MNYDGSGPTQNTDEGVPEQEREEGEDVEQDGEVVPEDDKWMDWDKEGNPKNPRFHRKFTGFLGKVGRRHVPINYTDWRKWVKENPQTTNKMWQQAKVKSW
jgi:hypothetical protein